MQKRNINLLLLLSGTITGVFFCEAILRIIAFSVTRNQYEGPSSYPENAVSIVCIGDSVTYGVGCREISGSYPDILQERLNGLNNQRFVVRNAGIPGSNAPRQLAMLKQELLKYDYNIAIILPRKSPSFEYNADLLSLSPPQINRYSLMADILLSKSRLYRLSKNIFVGMINKDRLKYQFDFPSRFPDKYKSCLTNLHGISARTTEASMDEPELLRAFKECLKIDPYCNQAYYSVLEAFRSKGYKRLPPEFSEIFNRNGKKMHTLAGGALADIDSIINRLAWLKVYDMVKTCQSHNTYIIFLTYPSVAPNSEDDYNKYIGKLAEKNGYLVIDLGRYFAQELNCERCNTYFIDDIHLNCEGYAKMADYISEQIAKNWGKVQSRISDDIRQIPAGSH